MTATTFESLELKDQIAVVLISLLHQVVQGQRTSASVEHPIRELFQRLAEIHNLHEKEVSLVVNAVATRGIEMLPAMQGGQQ